MTDLVPLQWLDWPASGSVKACFSLRANQAIESASPTGSQVPFNDYNYALHVGDKPEVVDRNRQQLIKTIGQQNIQWLEQVHGVDVVKASNQLNPKADAVYTSIHKQVCAVMTADCLPVFFCDQAGSQVAVAHAGWRGLAAGVLQQTLKQFTEPQAVMVYFGPAISQRAFEVGAEVRDAFVAQLPGLATCFEAKNNNKYMADLYSLARLLLTEEGVSHFYGGNRCTYSEAEAFYSYRRDGQTGRMVNLIWLD